MSVLLFIVGALAIVLGVGMVAYGVPVQEFAFGNTLIAAGTTLATGGLVVIAIAVAVRQLKRIGEMLASRAPARHPVEMFEPRSDAGRIPFPPRPANAGTAVSASAPASEETGAVVPMLQNPESPEPHEEKDFEEASLSPQQPAPAARPEPPPPARETPAAEKRREPLPEPPWRSSQPPQRQQEWPATSFEAMWPASSKRPPAEESDPAPQPEMVQSAPPETPPQRDPEVAILKSGVVDGMGYTLYVDGSIEAELPQGTLRFASINELREHLAKHS